jgi:hypothetical protein
MHPGRRSTGVRKRNQREVSAAAHSLSAQQNNECDNR